MLSIGRLFGLSEPHHCRGSRGLVQRAILAGCGALVILAVCSSQASAASPTLTLSPGSAAPGQTVTATGTGWGDPTRQGDVRIFADPSAVTDPSATPLATATPNSAGTFSAPLTVPNKPPGTYRFFACQLCGDVDGERSTTTPFTIAPPTTVSTTVPTTRPRPTVTQPRPTVTQPPVVTSSPIVPTPSWSPYTTLAIVLAVLVLLAVATWLFLRQRPTAKWRRPTWETQAEDAKRQGPCNSGSWYCHRGSPHLDLRFRRITALPVSIFSSETGRARRQVDAGDDVLAALNRCLDHQRAGQGAALVRRTAAAAAWGTWAVIQRELASASGPCDVFLFMDVQGGQATCPFTLYQCRRAQDSTSRWTRRAEWTGKLKDEKRYAVGVLRAAGDVPTIGDVVTEALTERFADVVRTISTDSLLDRIRLDSEWELDLGRWGRIHW